MKIKNKLHSVVSDKYHVVRYHDIELKIKKSHRYIAIDYNGKIYSFVYKPTICDNKWSISNGIDIDYVGRLSENYNNWNNSLVDTKQNVIRIKNKTTIFDNTYKVKYFDIKLKIDKKYKWLAIDKNGRLFAYITRPELSDIRQSWISTSEQRLQYTEVGLIHDMSDIDWTSTLRELNQIKE